MPHKDSMGIIRMVIDPPWTTTMRRTARVRLTTAGRTDPGLKRGLETK
jgi:hypothetical protein